MLLKRRFNQRLGLKSQHRVGLLSHRPFVDHLADVANDGHQVGFAPSVGKDQLGEVCLGHLEQLNLLKVSHQLDPFTSCRNRLSNNTGLGHTRALTQGQIPHLVQPLNDLVIDHAATPLPQFHHGAAIPVGRVLIGNRLQHGPQMGVWPRRVFSGGADNTRSIWASQPPPGLAPAHRSATRTAQGLPSARSSWCGYRAVS